MTTRTRSSHGATFRKAGWLAAGTMLAVAALAPSTVGAATVWATVTDHSAASAESNNPEFWGEDCTKIDAVGDSLGTSYVLGSDYGLVIVKAGSGEFANTHFADASAGESVWADTNGDGVFNPGGEDGDKGISHIIFCDPTETTSETTTETTDTTTETTDTTTETSDTTTETTDTTTETTDTTTETSETTTETTETTTETVDTTTSFTGEELPATGTPGITPPPTDTLSAVAPAQTTDGFRMLLVGFAILLGAALFLLPKEAAAKR